MTFQWRDAANAFTGQDAFDDDKCVAIGFLNGFRPAVTARLPLTAAGFGATLRAMGTHSVVVGYLLWIFGFLGAHRFYFGKPISGTIWFFTLGLFGVGWIVDLFLIPGMSARATGRFRVGRYDYTVAWLLLGFLGIFGVHRMYMGKWLTGILWLCTGGLLGIGLLYDLWTLNTQVAERNASLS